MEFLQQYKTEIDQKIFQFFDNYSCDNFSDSERKLMNGCKYAVIQGGKRVRPILGLMAWEAIVKKYEFKNTNLNQLQINRSTVIECLISLELIHASSLVHDDLPTMDNDLLRRGKQTVWKKYGEAEAILIGDMLITMAFENLAQMSPDFCIKNLIKILSYSSGNNGMIGGQMRDIDSENKDIDLQNLEIIHEKKTGALLKASAQFGTVLAKASTTDYEKISEYAQKIGLAFQIKDDLLDAEGDASIVGKAIGKDFNSKGYVSLLGLAATKEQLEVLKKEAIEIANSFNSDNLKQLTQFVVNRDR